MVLRRDNCGQLFLVFYLFLLFGSVLAIFNGTLEILDAFAESFAEVGELARSEDQKCDHQKNQQLRQS